MDVPSVEESLKGKGEADLFKELLRHLPTVQLEDYYKNGIWQNDVMKLDIQIVEAHRREAGAPDPLEPDEIPSFEVPILPKTLTASIRPAALMAPLRPLNAGAAVAAGLLRAAVPAPKAAPKVVGLRPVALLAAAKAAGEAAPAAAVPWGSPSDLQQLAGVGAKWKLDANRARALLALQLATFAAKWKLDAGRVSAVLAPLAAERRQFVLENFKVAPGEEGTAAAKLGAFVAECQRGGGAWAGAAAAAGAKRPLEIGQGQDPSKRPALAAVVAPGLQASRPAGGAAPVSAALEQSETYEPPLRATSLYDFDGQAAQKEWRPCEVIAYYRSDQQYLIRWPCGTLKQVAAGQVVMEGDQAAAPGSAPPPDAGHGWRPVA